MDFKIMYINSTKVRIIEEKPFNLVEVQIMDTGEHLTVDKMCLTERPDLTPTISLGLFGRKMDD